MKYKTVMLTVAPQGNKANNPNYRFRINNDDRKDVIMALNGKKDIYVVLESTLIKTKITCENNSYDLADAEINDWIKHKDFHLYPDREPTQLVCKLYNINDDVIIVYAKVR